MMQSLGKTFLWDESDYRLWARMSRIPMLSSLPMSDTIPSPIAVRSLKESMGCLCGSCGEAGPLLPVTRTCQHCQRKRGSTELVYRTKANELLDKITLYLTLDDLGVLGQAGIVALNPWKVYAYRWHKKFQRNNSPLLWKLRDAGKAPKYCPLGAPADEVPLSWYYR